jgi:hypothetical protein
LNHRAHREHGENHNDLSGKIIGCAIRVHKELGPGLLETAYGTCLAHELTLNDVNVEVEKMAADSLSGFGIGRRLSNRPARREPHYSGTQVRGKSFTGS